jgi:hypothetical protein
MSGGAPPTTAGPWGGVTAPERLDCAVLPPPPPWYTDKPLVDPIAIRSRDARGDPLGLSTQRRLRRQAWWNVFARCPGWPLPIRVSEHAIIGYPSLADNIRRGDRWEAPAVHTFWTACRSVYQDAPAYLTRKPEAPCRLPTIWDAAWWYAGVAVIAAGIAGWWWLLEQALRNC